MYAHHEVADLEWVIRSAPLMNDSALKHLYTPDTDWFENQYFLHRDWLRELDTDPSLLFEWLREKQPRLLGKKFECLMEFWFRNSGSFNLLMSNVPFISDNRTEGEIDFVVEDLAEERTLQLEISCKYYLGYQNSSLWKNWIGPNGSDTLEQKLNKIPVQLKNGARYLKGIQIEADQAWMMKGYFFHHFKNLGGQKDPSNSGHRYSAGWYAFETELQEMISPVMQYVILPRSMWMSPFFSRGGATDIISGTEMITRVRQSIAETNKAQMIVQVIDDGEKIAEISRGFIVRKGWPHLTVK